MRNPLRDIPYTIGPAPLPDWLSVSPFLPDPIKSKLTPVKREIELLEFPSLFDRVLLRIEAGDTLETIIEEDPRPLRLSGFRRWIHADPERLAQFRQSQAIGAEVLADQCVRIADAQDSLEDVQRSTLKVNTRMKYIAPLNRQRYGDIKQVDVNTSINIAQVLEDANRRVDEVVDIEFVEKPANP